MPAEGTASVLFVMPPGGVTTRFSEHLGTAFLRAVLARAGIRSQQYLPDRNVSLPAFARFLRERRPALVGFTAYESNLRACRAMARAVRESLPEAIVVAGGPNATFTPEETLDLLGADLCLRGAGEGTIVAIARAVLGAERPRRRLWDLLSAVPNLVVRTADGPRRTRAAGLSSFPAGHFGSLDDLPSPYRDGIVATPDVGLLTARGCNQRCTYCSFAAISGHRVHYHGVERVLDDLAALKALAGRVAPRRPTVSIFDDAFTLAPRRARAICEGIVERGLELPLECETRADRVDADLLRLMRRAGFTSVSFGLESAVPRVLRAMGKVQDPFTRDDPGLEAERDYLARFRRAVAWAKDAGLVPFVSVIGGFPGETADDLRATLAFVRSLDVPMYAHNVLSALPGTPLYRDRHRHGLGAARDRVTGAWRTYHGYDVASVRPLRSSSTYRGLWEEAGEVSDALCGRPRPERADDGAAWAIVLHRDAPDAPLVAWLREVLAVSGAVVVVSAARPPRRAGGAAWLRALCAERVPFGVFALLAPERAAGGLAYRSLGTLGDHRFEVGAGWPAEGRAVEAAGSRGCRVPLWLAPDAAAPPPAPATGTLGLVPQVVDGCRWWSGWRRCRRPRVLHVLPDSTVHPCWRGPAIGRVGDGWAELAAAGRALGPADAEWAADPCPLGRYDKDASQWGSAARELEVAARASWLLGQAAAER